MPSRSKSKVKERKGGAPRESATGYEVGKRKRGTDGEWYYVNKGRRWTKKKNSQTFQKIRSRSVKSRQKWKKPIRRKLDYKKPSEQELKELEEEEKKNASFFVAYKIGGGGEWTYPHLPKGWWWVGAGQTGLARLPREEQFTGPKEGRKKAKEKVDSVFRSLKQKGVVRNYKLINDFSWVLKEREKEK